MRPNPLIAEAGTYGVAILLILSLSAFSLASHIHSRLRQQRIPFLVVYCTVLAFISVWGALVLNPARWFHGGICNWLVAAAAGLVLGIVATRADRLIVRNIERRRRLNPRLYNAVPSDLWYSLSPVRSFREGPSSKRGAPLAPVRGPDMGSKLIKPALTITLVAIVGGLEELLYRAILVQFCFLLRYPVLVAVALCCTVVMFGLSHIEFGWPQVLSKLPLGALALVGTLATGNVFCALIAHGLFNILNAGTNE
jgi:membrane protease YdiL (CAAX protease family)